MRPGQNSDTPTLRIVRTQASVEDPQWDCALQNQMRASKSWVISIKWNEKYNWQIKHKMAETIAAPSRCVRKDCYFYRMIAKTVGVVISLKLWLQSDTAWVVISLKLWLQCETASTISIMTQQEIACAIRRIEAPTLICISWNTMPRTRACAPKVYIIYTYIYHLKKSNI
jgi:hypothetical protein